MASIADEEGKRRKRRRFSWAPKSAEENEKGRGLTSFAAESPSAEAVGRSEDLILEILYRLPIASLFKFRVVSKSWRSLLSHPHFPHAYSIRQPPPDSSLPAGFLFKIKTEKDTFHAFTPINEDDAGAAGVPDPSLSFLGEKLVIRHSCNGLLLCELDYQDRSTRLPTIYYVCNPFTKEFMEIVSHCQQGSSYGCWSVVCGLAFNPSISPHYKVVSIKWDSLDDAAPMIFIYSSETGMWTSRSDLLLPPFSSNHSSVALWKGALHWASGHRSTFSFHPERECFWVAPRPNPFLNLSNRVQASSGDLKLIERTSFMRYTISRMDRHFKQWFICHQLNLEFCQGPRLFQRFGLERFLHLYNTRKGTRTGGKEKEEGEEEEEEYMLFLDFERKIIVYSIRDRTWQDVCQVVPLIGFSPYAHAYSYTLLPPNPPPLHVSPSTSSSSLIN